MSSIDPIISESRPLIISGPCSAETPQQVMETALQLAASGRVQLFRAGLWKPRTRPDSFEGVGEAGLPWLKEVKQATGLPVIVEVAKASHIEKALAAGIDAFWIGARSSANPFSIQELADAVRGTDIPVLVKNPTNADLDLWMGGIERFMKAGIRSIGAVHRGFSTYGHSDYRNPPMWHIPIELKRRFPEMLLLCDPSHICGNRHLIQKVVQRSIDLGFNGVMIETHIDPEKALSDAAQQITPARLLEMLDQLIWRVEYSAGTDSNTLAGLRHNMDVLDEELLNLMGQRMQLAERIGLYKKAHNMTILQTKRWNEILEKGLLKGENLQLSKDFVLRYFNAIHLESIRHQHAVMNREEKAGSLTSSSSEHAVG